MLAAVAVLFLAGALTPEQEAEIAPLLKALELKPQSAFEYARAGEALTKVGDPRSAVNALRIAVQLSPHNDEVYGQLGFALFRAAESVDRHIERLQPGSTKYPARRVEGDDDPCWRVQPSTCFELEHYKRHELNIAEADFLKRVEDPNDSHGFALLAQFYRNRSVDACVSALRLQPQRANAYMTLARVLPVGGAVGPLRRALELLPTHAAGYRELGELLTKLRYFRQANDAYRLLLKLAPDQPSSYHNLAELRLLRTRPDEAHAFASSALALQLPNILRPGAADGEPYDGAAAYRAERAAVTKACGDGSGGGKTPRSAAESVAMMAEARAQQQRYADTESLARCALGIQRGKKKPVQGEVGARGYRLLGHALYEMQYVANARGRHEEATAACKEAVRLLPVDTSSHFRLATMLRTVPGRLREAVEHYNGCLRVDSQFPGAQQAQEEVRQQILESNDVPRGDLSTLWNLFQVIVLMGLASFFMMKSGWAWE